MTAYLDQSTAYDNDAFAGAFDMMSFWTSRFGHLLFAHLPLAPGGRVLDLGCGTGFPLIELAQMLGRSAQVVGVDPWAAGLARARLKQQVYDQENVALVRGDGARLPFPAATFDLIVSNLGINNFADPPAVLAECARVARPGARLALTTNIQGHMALFYAVFRTLLAERGDGAALERLAAHVAHRGTRESVAALLEGGGFRVVRVVEDQFVLRYADGSALLWHGLTRFGFLDGWRAVIGGADERAIFAELEARLNILAARLVELRLAIPMLYIEGERA